MDIKIFIVFCSPAGSTRRVAEFIKEEFNHRKAEVVMLDLGKKHDLPGILNAMKRAGKHACLFIGSPVYRDVAIPPVINFIETLPKMAGAYAVPFVTWGLACTQCGVCEEECSVSAVALNPYPEFDQTCFDCFNCIRLCPETALEPAISMDQIERHIRERVRTINERPLTQIFL